MMDIAWLIPAFPLAGFLLIFVFGRKLGEPFAGVAATLMTAAAFLVTAAVYLDMVTSPEEERTSVINLFSWVPVANLQVDLAFLIDPLSVTMALFITGIGSLIHLYAIGYMHGDPKFSKFFLYLNLFVFSMLMLVMGENLLVTFLGWEGVGACSYFLISFWHNRDSAATAGKKAFVTNRVGDWGVMMAMFLGFGAVGTLSYQAMNNAATTGWAPTIIAVVGAVTALYAATIAVAQTDIKKVLAYSTVSQLGFMFLAIGSGAYVAAIFHMITHAFFKALLFLGSGSVIHGMHHEQDMRRMGALRKVMPITAFTFIIGWLAIAGVPPFAGFWSKDEVLLFAFANNRFLYIIGLVTALLTAYYMTRQVIMVFFGEARWHDHSEEHGAHGDHTPHESPFTMLTPLIVLSGLSIAGGVLQLPFSKSTHFLEHWLHPVIKDSEVHIDGTWAYDNKWLLMGVAIVVASAGIILSVLVYSKKKIKAVEPAILEQGWYYDKAISSFVGGPGKVAFSGVAEFDAKVVDGAVNGSGISVRSLSGFMRKLQSGLVRSYALIIGIGVIAILVWFFVRGVI